MNYKKLISVAGSVCMLTAGMYSPCSLMPKDVYAAVAQQTNQGADVKVSTDFNSTDVLKAASGTETTYQMTGMKILQHLTSLSMLSKQT